MTLSSEELTEIVATMREFVRGVVVPAEERIDEIGEVPAEIRAQAAEIGLYGFALPEEYGGLGLTAYEEAHLAFEIGWTTPSFRSSFGTNNAIGGQAIAQSGTAEQKERYLPRMAAGELITSFALTEEAAGSDAGALKTFAAETPEGFVINGSKQYITNSPVAGLFVVFARTATEDGGSAVSAFLIERDTPGIEVGKRDVKMGQHGAMSAPVTFTDVRVPREALLGGVQGQGLQAAMRSLNRGRLHVAALCVGLSDRLIAESVAYAEQRQQFGHPIADFQLVQAHIARQTTLFHAARSLVLDACREFDERGPRVIEMAASAKLFASESVGEIADRAVQIHGGSGYMRGVAVERFYRDARLYRIYEGTSEILQLTIAKQVRRRTPALV